MFIINYGVQAVVRGTIVHNNNCHRICIIGMIANNRMVTRYKNLKRSKLHDVALLLLKKTSLLSESSNFHTVLPILNIL